MTLYHSQCSSEVVLMQNNRCTAHGAVSHGFQAAEIRISLQYMSVHTQSAEYTIYMICTADPASIQCQIRLVNTDYYNS